MPSRAPLGGAAAGRSRPCPGWAAAELGHARDLAASGRSPFPRAGHHRPISCAGRAALTPDSDGLRSGRRRASPTASCTDRARRRSPPVLRRAGRRPRGAGRASCSNATSTCRSAVLGVLEAGAAYLPLDPAYPADRLRYLLEDSGAPAAADPPPRLAGQLGLGRFRRLPLRRLRRAHARAPDAPARAGGRPRRPRRPRPTCSTPRARPANPKARRSPTARWSTCWWPMAREPSPRPPTTCCWRSPPSPSTSTVPRSLPAAHGRRAR